MAKRRVQGEGSIYQRKDGRWAGSYEVGWANGKRVRKSVYGATQAELLTNLKRVRRQVDDHLPVPDERLTLGTYLTQWLESVQPPVIRPHTHLRYSTVVRLHIVPALGKVKLVRLTPIDVERLLASKRKTLAPRTVQEVRTILVTALNKAVRQGQLARNPAALAECPGAPHHEITPLTPAQARQFLDAVAGHRFGPLFLLAIATGARQGELLGLKWDDIDFDAGYLHIRRALARVPSEGGEGAVFQLTETKTARSRRSVALPAFALQALREHRVHQLEERLAAGRNWAEAWAGLVFLTKAGQPLHGAVVTHSFQKVLAAAELPRARFHDLRHAAATFLLSQGASLKDVQEQLGHSTIAVTGNIYSHVLDEMKQANARRMDALLAPRMDAAGR